MFLDNTITLMGSANVGLPKLKQKKLLFDIGYFGGVQKPNKSVN